MSPYPSPSSIGYTISCVQQEIICFGTSHASERSSRILQLPTWWNYEPTHVYLCRVLAGLDDCVGNYRYHRRLVLDLVDRLFHRDSSLLRLIALLQQLSSFSVPGDIVPVDLVSQGCRIRGFILASLETRGLNLEPLRQFLAAYNEPMVAFFHGIAIVARMFGDAVFFDQPNRRPLRYSFVVPIISSWLPSVAALFLWQSRALLTVWA